VSLTSPYLLHLLLRTSELKTCCHSCFREIWEGPSSGVDAASEWFGANEAYNVENLMDVLVNNSHICNKYVYYNDIPTDHYIKTAVLTALQGSKKLSLPYP
jgi:hypothetical protein